MSFDEELKLLRVRAAIELAQLGLKLLALVNGAAVVALLTFLGNSAMEPERQSLIAWALISFAAGVGLSLIATVIGYLATLMEAWAPDREDGREPASSYWLRTTAIVAAIFVLVAFFLGVGLAARAFIMAPAS